MYVGTVKVGEREYVRIVESVRVGGRPRPRVVANLGNVETLRSSIPTIIRGLHRVLGEDPLLQEGELENLDHAEYGVGLAGNALWEELGLGRALRRCFRSRGSSSSTEILIRTMVLNRLSEPCSKLAIARWLEDVSLGEEADSFFARHRDDAVALADRFYKAMDSLLRHRAAVERHLFHRLKDLFHLDVDAVFYDLTSTYFEGSQAEYGWFGYSRDERPGNLQIVVGLVLVDGFPISHQVFKGYRRDSTCLETALEQIERRFHVRRIILVGDRGLLSEQNVALLRAKGHEYILACRKRNDRLARYALRLRPRMPVWDPEHETKPEPVIWAMRSKDGDRVIGYANPVAAHRDRMRRGEILEAFREELKDLQQRFKRDTGLSRDERVSLLTELLARRKGLGKRYFSAEIDTQGHLVYRSKQRVLDYEALLDGTTILRTNTERLDDAEIVARYKELARVERAFRDLKSFIDLRPLHHRVARRIAAHVFVCMLSLLLERMIDRKLQAAGMPRTTANEALRKLKRIRLLRDCLRGVEIERIAGLGQEQRRILNALGVKDPNRLVAARRVDD